MPDSKSITMSELAKLAGVDISTVSRALNDSPLVKDKTKNHIRKLAGETGYAINARARSLRTQSSQTIGLIIPVGADSSQNISDPFILEMVGAVSQAASKYDYDLIINLPREAAEIAERRLLFSGKADGLIIIGQAGRAKRLKALGAAADRVVVWGGLIDNPSYTLVGSDNYEGGRLATQHLLDVGRRKLVFLGDISLPEVGLRYDGMVSKLKDAGVVHTSEMIVSSSFDGREGHEKMQAFLEIAPEFDAVFAASDVLAMSAIHAMQSRNISVPKNVSVVGYDNIGHSSMVTPGLTTIDQNIYKGAEIMIDALIKKIEGETVASQLTPTNLIIRGSSIP